MEIKSFFDTFTNIWIKPAKQQTFFPVSNFHVLTEDMDSGGERLGGQMFGRRRRVLSKEYLLSENGQQPPSSLLKFHFPLESRKL